MENQIKEDLKKAMLARQVTTVNTLRMLISEIRNSAIAKQNINFPLSDAEIVAVVQKEIKKRKEAAAGFRQGGREEDAQKEEAEAKVLSQYLPAQISDEELTKAVEDTINEMGATNIADMGKVIGAVLRKVGQAAEGSRVSVKVRERLTGG